MFNKIMNKIENKKMHIEQIDDPELNEFLSKHVCHSCHNHCRLNDIKCGGGNKARRQKIAEYQQ